MENVSHHLRRSRHIDKQQLRYQAKSSSNWLSVCPLPETIRLPLTLRLFETVTFSSFFDYLSLHVYLFIHLLPIELPKGLVRLFVLAVLTLCTLIITNFSSFSEASSLYIFFLFLLDIAHLLIGMSSCESMANCSESA